MKILIPLPSHDFDPTEAAVSWKILRDAGHDIVFATPDGRPGHADPIMLSGEGLDPWGFIPGLRKLRVTGLSLRANADARRAYAEMELDPGFLRPLRYEQLRVEDFDGLLLPGGHAKRMRPYLESGALQSVVAGFFDADKPVAAVCHGVVLAARSVSKKSGKSVLYGRKTTALTWPLENAAWTMSWLIRFWDRHYYRTYIEERGEPVGYRSVQAEVMRALSDRADFLDVPGGTPHLFRKASGLFRDSASDERPAWVVVDGRYVSARWPGDVHTFARTFARLLALQGGLER